MRNEWSVDPCEMEARASYTRTPSAQDALVAAAVEDLPADLRDIINALHWEGLSCPQAIRSLALAPATFYRRKRQAEAVLVEALQGLYAVGEVPAGH